MGIKNISKRVYINVLSWVSTFAGSLVTMQTFCLLLMPVIIQCTGFVVTGPFRPNDRTFWETVENEETTPADRSPGPWCCGGTPWGRGSAWTPAGGQNTHATNGIRWIQSVDWETRPVLTTGGGCPASGCQKDDGREKAAAGRLPPPPAPSPLIRSGPA